MKTSTEDLLLILDTIAEPYIRLANDKRLTFANTAAESMFGMSRKELAGKTPCEAHAGLGALLEEGWRRVQVERSSVRFDNYDQSSGRWFRVSAAPDSMGGVVVRMSDVVSDRPNQTPTLFDSMLEGVALHKLVFNGGVPSNYILLDVNRRYEQITGIKRREVIDRLATEVYRTTDAPYLNEYAHAVASKSAFSFETYFPPMDRHFAISALPLGNDLFVTVFFDISDRKRTEAQLRHTEELFARAFQGNPAATTIVDLETNTYMDVNEAFEQLSGYSRQEVIGKHWDEVRLWTDPVRRKDAVAELSRAGRLRNWEFEYRKKSGEAGTALISAEALEINGRPCSITTSIDITERLHLQNQLRQAQKLESIGRLAGGVAHDFNNVLTVISGYGELLSNALPMTDSLRAYVDEIKRAASQASTLTQQLLAFSRKQAASAKPIDLNSVVKDAERMLRRVIGEDVNVVITLDPLLGQVSADSNQMHQVIMNLVVNARDAMPNGGVLTISTANVELGETAAAEHPETDFRQSVSLSVSDTGIGISPETIQSIFDPFFTTKQLGKGTGLGLSMVHGIVRQSRGWIEVASKLGAGSTFTVHLPRIEKAIAQAKAEPDSSRSELAGTETVLVVEDDGGVRNLIARALSPYGYEVLEAASVEEAITAAGDHEGVIHVLLTDMVLAGMTGRQLWERLRSSRPEMKVLFTSGDPDEIPGPSGVHSGVAYITKPFGGEALAAKLREVLKQRNPDGCGERPDALKN
ncbi:MAG: PAS domain S-box protein [Bryobacteraceae bacterium]